MCVIVGSVPAVKVRLVVVRNVVARSDEARLLWIG